MCETLHIQSLYIAASSQTISVENVLTLKSFSESNTNDFVVSLLGGLSSLCTSHLQPWPVWGWGIAGISVFLFFKALVCGDIFMVKALLKSWQINVKLPSLFGHGIKSPCFYSTVGTIPRSRPGTQALQCSRVLQMTGTIHKTTYILLF